MRAKDNPFRVQRLDRLGYRLEGASWEGLLARWEALGRRAALVGLEGRGKTTLLEELAGRLSVEQGFRVRGATLRRGQRELSPGEHARLLGGAGERDLLLVDGAQELSAGAWRRLGKASRAAGGLLVTSHRPGLLPTLHECRTTPSLLAELIAELAGGDSVAGVDVLPRAEELFARHAGNLRDALLEAYDRCARASQMLGRAHPTRSVSS
jgi:hypothetical protein